MSDEDWDAYVKMLEEFIVIPRARGMASQTSWRRSQQGTDGGQTEYVARVLLGEFDA